MSTIFPRDEKEYEVYWQLPIEQKKQIYTLKLAEIVNKRPHLFYKDKTNE